MPKGRERNLRSGVGRRSERVVGEVGWRGAWVVKKAGEVAGVAM